ncbi:hypothetical protein Tco_0878115 [Tanacetum coccineum]|uniref:Uncharacterized protein n=1 Tax=Tanacetum coccineum TaxID=301880 RepID=A0ABQ5C2C4_9ASTR
MSLGTTFITSSILNCLHAPLVVCSIGVCGTPTITGQMANSVALVEFGGTWVIVVIVAFGAPRFVSSISFLITKSHSVGSTSVLPLVLLLLLVLIVLGSIVGNTKSVGHFQSCNKS